jgi:hypothetical protein
MILRILLVGAIAIGALTYVKQDSVLARFGLVGSCTPAEPAAGATLEQRSAQWWSCGSGSMTGYPSLERRSCDSLGFAGTREVWACRIPIESAS